MHFKELFLLDGKSANLDETDIGRRNLIVQLLEDWGLVEVLKRDMIKDKIPLNKIKIISFKDKPNWLLEAKYSIGNDNV